MYVALEPETALAEYTQSSPFLSPTTVVSYTARLPGLVDLRLLDHEWDELWHDWQEDWRAALFYNGAEPVTWVLGNLVRAAGHAGILFPSTLHAGGTNLVLFHDVVDVEGCVRVNGPDLLPRNQSSWD